MTAFLTKEEEVALAHRWKAGDVRAMHKIVEAHIPLAKKLVRRWGGKYDIEDLLSEACLGMMKAMEKFDPDQGYRFSTYAQHWISAQLAEFMFRNESIVRRPLSLKGKERKNPTMKKAEAISLSSIVGGTDSLTLGDTLVDENPLPDEIVERVVDTGKSVARLGQTMTALDDRERMIFEERHLRDQPTTLDDLGKRLGISKERVRQIDDKALGRITAAMKRPVLEAAE